MDQTCNTNLFITFVNKIRANIYRERQTSDNANKLATALEIREGVQEQLDVVMKTIIAAGEQVKKLQVENCLEIAELISAMKMTPSSASGKPTYIFSTPTISSPVNKFVLGESSIFILKLLQSGILKGEIRIRPLLTFHPEFIQHLGKFCYKSPKYFSTTVKKVYCLFKKFLIKDFNMIFSVLGPRWSVCIILNVTFTVPSCRF